MLAFSLTKLKVFLLESLEFRKHESKRGKVRESRNSLQKTNSKLIFKILFPHNLSSSKQYISEVLSMD